MNFQKFLDMADNAIYCHKDSDVDYCLTMLDDQYAGIDTETTGFDPYGSYELIDGRWESKAFIRVITIEANDQCVVFDLKILSDESILKICKYLTDPDRILIMQNAKFDIKWMLALLPIKKFNRIYDTMLASQLIACGRVKFGHSLKQIVKNLFEYEMDKEMGGSNWAQGELDEKQLKYAALDAIVLRPIREKQIPELQKLGLMEAANIEFRCAEPVAYMEMCGIRLHKDRWLRNAIRNKWRAIRMEAKVSKALEPPGPSTMLFDNIPTFKVSSTLQLKQAMESIGIEIPTMVKKGVEKDTIQVDYLEKIKDRHPSIPLIIKYSTLKKAHTSYGQNWVDKIHPVTGRIHPDIFQIGTDTYRFAFRDPNLQQIPVENIYRHCFIPGDGNLFIGGDYNAAELRIIACASQDRAMLEAYNSGKDLHTFTASVVFKVPYEKMMAEIKGNPEYKIYRTRAKNLNFGIVYGIGAKRFAKNADISEEEAWRIIDDYFDLYCGLKQWLEWAKKEAVFRRRSLSLSGRRYTHYVNPSTDDRTKIGIAERFGCNFPIQATNADITKIALRNIYDQLGDRAKIVNCIHDEILIECKAEEAEEIKPIFDKCMIEAGEVYIRDVPVIVESEILQRWSK